MFYSIRDAYDCLIGEYDTRDDAMIAAEDYGKTCTVYRSDSFAVATFQRNK